MIATTQPTTVTVLAGRDVNRYRQTVTLIAEDGYLYEVVEDGTDYSRPIRETADRSMIKGWGRGLGGSTGTQAVVLDNGWEIPVRALKRIHRHVKETK